jgi:hypothetical protein
MKKTKKLKKADVAKTLPVTLQDIKAILDDLTFKVNALLNKSESKKEEKISDILKRLSDDNKKNTPYQIQPNGFRCPMCNKPIGLYENHFCSGFLPNGDWNRLT